MTTTLKTQMLERLMDCGTWLSRADLVQGLSTSPVAIEDALADLVLERRAEFRQAVGYRLAGTVLTRAAARVMRVNRARRGAFGKQVQQEYRVGVAEQRAGLGVVMYELAMPMPASGPQFLDQHMAQVNAVIEFTNRAIERGT